MADINDTPELLPRKTVVGGETVEEHSLKDRAEYDRYKNQQTDQTATPQEGKFGLGVFRTRLRHGRP